MAVIKPFKAIRPAKDKVSFVASRSYDEYSKKELDCVLDYNPFSFLHIINPGNSINRKVSGKERFKLIHNRYLDFLKNQILIKDNENSLYIYKIEKDNFNCCGIICATSTEDYRNSVIKKHENTLEKREKLFANYLQLVKFKAEPVLMIYPDTNEISAIVNTEIKNHPQCHFTTPDNETHTLWKISAENTLKQLQNEFGKVNSLYIADGHHRSASSNLLSLMSQKKNPGHTGKEPYNFIMSYLIPQSEIRIFEFNRMVRDLNGLTAKEFLIKLDKFYTIKNHGNHLYKPDEKHHFSMYLNGSFYSLSLRKNVYKFTDALSKLDTQILYKTILEPILQIKNLRNDKRIQYGHGKRNVLKMKNEIDKEKFAVGFGLVPLDVEEIKAIADAGLVMPPKSTYIEPKLRSALAIFDLSTSVS
ncbi:DUF1015 domain-containing protein [Eudoraea sp.]|uniref:DUF1015 domain-containing protein n=2 Tax=Eudoraea sp. TaxID=1979955 RepID=UPI003C7560EF